MYGMRYHKAISFTDMTQTNVYSDSSLMGFEYWDGQKDGRKKKKKKGQKHDVKCILILLCLHKEFILWNLLGDNMSVLYLHFVLFAPTWAENQWMQL